MESIRTWFQDWSDACEYAKECAPDLSFLTLNEPWSAFLALAALCFVAWLLNEKRLSRLLARERRHLHSQAAFRATGELGLTLGQMKAAHPPVVEKQAA
jgi:hypothetical protein